VIFQKSLHSLIHQPDFLLNFRTKSFMKTVQIIALLLPVLVHAQDSGQKDFPNLGISFTIPSGWVGQENQSGYLMGSYTDPGIILVMPHQTKDLNQLKGEATQGVHDDQGTSLMPDGPVQDFSNNGIEAFYQGTVGYQPAKAYAVGLINQYGTGVTIIAMTTTDQFSELHKNLAREVAGSVHFSKPVITESKSGWGDMLKNARLTYMHSYSSNTGSYGGYTTGGGFSDKEVIDLCAQGYFNHSSSSSLSIDTGGAFGHSSDSGQGSGTWKVIVNTQGQDVLQLNFYNGEVYEYVLSLEDNKTFLNGRRFFRTYGTTADDGPSCY
jgi:hypothetical protein